MLYAVPFLVNSNVLDSSNSFSILCSYWM